MKFFKFILCGFFIFLLSFICGCGSVQENYTGKTIIDSAGRKVVIPENIQTAVVANRYNMEIIKSLNAQKHIIGVDYGIYQDQKAYGDFFTEQQIIGKSQSDLNYEKIIELDPDILIIAGNGLWKDAEEKLAPFDIKVVVVNPYYADKFTETYTLVGKIFNKEKEAKEFIHFFENKLNYIHEHLKNVKKKTIYYEYKKEGTTTIPGDYFYEMLNYAHVENIFKDSQALTIDIESVVARNPDIIVKVGDAGKDPSYTPPSENEFKLRKNNIISRPGWETINAVKNDKILLLSQYAHGGASKIIGTCYIAKYVYPEYLPDLHPEEVFKEWVTKYQHLPYIEGHTYPRFSLTD